MLHRIPLFVESEEFGCVGSLAGLVISRQLLANIGNISVDGAQPFGTLLSFASTVGDISWLGEASATKESRAAGCGIIVADSSIVPAGVRTSFATGQADVANMSVSGSAIMTATQCAFEGFITADDDKPMVDANGEFFYVELAR